jgi:hypothetical protein
LRERAIATGWLRAKRLGPGGEGTRAYVLIGMATGDPLYELEDPGFLLDECAGGPVLVAGAIVGVVGDLPVLRVTRVDRLGTP